ncbi:MAG: transposase [Bacteroidales bacterium]|nr:transposase [Bacteroidales bacterium]
MISKVKSTKLVEIFFYVSDAYEKELKFSCERFSNNSCPGFTDQEIMTVYLFCISQEQRTKIKQIYNFANEYLRSWFPKLPSYAAFNNRINRLSEAFRLLTASLLQTHQPLGCFTQESLLDSLPVITCSGKRVGKVAPELTEKGYCSTKSMYYFGLKLHALAFRRENQLPFPEQLLITAASENDLNVFRNAWSNIENRTFFGDKIYHDHDFFERLFATQNAVMMTPVKAVKGQSEWEKQHDRAANDLFSKAVSKVRQPIEGWFNWLIEKTDFQRASKVRSAKGLLVHVFGKLAAAFIYLIFNP